MRKKITFIKNDEDFDNANSEDLLVIDVDFIDFGAEKLKLGLIGLIPSSIEGINAFIIKLGFFDDLKYSTINGNLTSISGYNPQNYQIQEDDGSQITFKYVNHYETKSGRILSNSVDETENEFEIAIPNIYFYLYQFMERNFAYSTLPSVIIIKKKTFKKLNSFGKINYSNINIEEEIETNQDYLEIFNKEDIPEILNKFDFSLQKICPDCGEYLEEFNLFFRCPDCNYKEEKEENIIQNEENNEEELENCPDCGSNLKEYNLAFRCDECGYKKLKED